MRTLCSLRRETPRGPLHDLTEYRSIWMSRQPAPLMLGDRLSKLKADLNRVELLLAHHHQDNTCTLDHLLLANTGGKREVERECGEAGRLFVVRNLKGVRDHALYLV
ncbi:hypothetical protein A8D95_21450 [Burkholderia cenocepacia]|nr:hypothetical protein [Burkholderia contaminans]ONP68708.1 hypothetical protein A8D88_11990 [Burkholderia cenocepacia]MBA9933285.1 hypothetical protein [Burkholderia contaminans]ONP71243.1 hypothetical protein A8D94_20590 [Burkholderia cenocepacia]ONQ25465.1 hypothetical protein A8D95_21450 [Burkholderia cenocepacia]